MPLPRAFKGFTLALLCLAAAAAPAQTPAPGSQEGVVRVESELVQTEVMVFDKQGKFVDDLTREQFELKVDGAPVPVAFFDRVTSKAAADDAAAPAAAGATPADATPALARGRTIIFFIDDLHLSLSSLAPTRAALTRFIEEEMGPRDRVMFVTASGQLGFLQQFTDHKGVLRTAVARLRHVPNTTQDTDRPAMTEYIALRIINGDLALTSFYMEKIMEGFAFKGNANKGLNQHGIKEMVRNRANNIVKLSESVTDRTLGALEYTMRTASRVGGRKLVFFISDGFFLGSKNTPTGANTQFNRVVDLAARTGSVFYTVDARGLFAPVVDATDQKPMDKSGRVDRSSFGEGLLSQEGLNALAGDTGGEFLRNTNYFDRWVSRRLEETSSYYLLAWRPAAEEQKGGRFRRMEVAVKGRPDLTVRLHRGYLAGNGRPPAEKKGGAKIVPVKDAGAGAPAGKVEEDVREALVAPVGDGARLPTLVSATFVDVPGTGPVLTSSVQVAAAGLGYGPDGRQEAAVDVAGVILDIEGKQAAGFKTRLNVAPPAAGAPSGEGVIYNHRAPLAPGLYQVRVAARDDRTGQVGSSAQWVEIPDLSKRQLALSSLHLGGRAVSGGAGGSEQVQFSVDRRFARSSRVDFIAFVYNASRAGTGAPDLSAQVRVWRGGRAVVAGQPRKLQPDAGADAARVPLSGAINLGQLPAGLYELEVTVTDNLARVSATERAAFEVQ